MIGELETRQICALLEQGVTPEDISRELNLPIEQVKLAGVRNELVEERDITDDELSALRKHAFSLAMGADSHEVQAKMTLALLERDRPSKKEAQPVMLTSLINQNIVVANEKYKEMLADYSKPLDSK